MSAPYSKKVLREIAADLSPAAFAAKQRRSTGEREMAKDLRNEARRLHPIHSEKNRTARLQRNRDVRVARAVVSKIQSLWFDSELGDIELEEAIENLDLAALVSKVRHPKARGGK